MYYHNTVITLYTQILNALLPFTYHTIQAHPGLAERIRNKIGLCCAIKPSDCLKVPDSAQWVTL